MTLIAYVLGGGLGVWLVLDAAYKLGRLNGYKRGVAKTEHDFAQLLALGGVGPDGAGPRAA